MNKTKVMLAAGALALLPLSSFAERSLLSVVEIVDINAKPSAVWEQIRNFDGLPKWHPAVAKSRIVAGKNNEPGAARELTIKDGPMLTDELISLNDERMFFTYRLVESPLPVTDYLSSVSVKPRGAGSEVIWTVTFKRKNASDSPAANESDAGGMDLLGGVYRAGLDNLKKMLEGK
jgi:Polyketide cyclase / dehydrase and lipid transport